MNPIDNSISIGNKSKTEGIEPSKNITFIPPKSKSTPINTSIEKLKTSKEISYIYNQFINYNQETSKTIFLKDTLKSLHTTIKNSSQKNLKEIIKSYMEQAIYKGEKILKNYEKILTGGDENSLLASIEKLITSTDYKIKRLNIIIQNLDSVASYQFDNTNSILTKTVNLITERMDNSNLNSLIQDLQGEKVIRLLG